MRRLTFISIIFLTVVPACRVSDAMPPMQEAAPVIRDYEEAIQNLEQGKDKQTIAHAIQMLYTAKTQAFPSLIAHLNDKRDASLEHFGDQAYQCAPAANPCIPWHPTIGEACFSIIQSQVEGNWPKGYRNYYSVTPKNAVRWWESHRGMSLKELQLDAAQASLETARNDYQHKRDFNAIKFLEAHLKDVQEGRCCPE